MAYGSELYLGLMGSKEVMDTLTSLGLKCDADYYLDEDANLERIQSDLVKAHKEALEELGLVFIDPKTVLRNGKPVEDGYAYVMGLDGRLRQTCSFRLEIDYDPHEMGHTNADALIGVSLISRYFPVYLDWDKDHGGSGDTMLLTPEWLKAIEIARKHIAKVLPFIANAPIVFRERHY